MAEFISLLIGYTLMALADSVDNAFATNISIDAIVVLGCLLAISQITKAFARIGSYAYRILRQNEIQCIQLDLIAGSIIGLAIFLFKDIIVSIFTITNEQANLFRQVLIAWSFYIPTYGVGNTSFELVRLNGKIKLYNIGLFIFYIILIASDILVFFTIRSLPMLFIATAICQIIATIFFYIKMQYKFKLINIKFIRQALPYSIPIAIERLINGFCHTAYGALASRLGTIQYAIHTVCFGAITTGEQITNSYNAALMIKVPLNKKFKETRKNIKDWAKRMFPILFITYYIYAFISLYIYSGNLDFRDCFPWFFIYTFEFFGLFCYENMKVMCAIQKHVKAYPIGVIFGFIFRLSISYIGLYTKYPLIYFAIGTSFDWAVRGIIYYISLYRYSSIHGEIK